MRIPHPIPYQGSKRNIADSILKYFPDTVDRLIEPFTGSAAISIASAYFSKAKKFVLNDKNEPLMNLWKEIIYNPHKLISNYHRLWHSQLGDEENFYFEVRAKFNREFKPEYLLYLLARCVKAAVRYNAKGEFNQSADNRRKGRVPESMRNDILSVSELLRNKVELFSLDYKGLLSFIQKDDLVYLDPPYQGTGANGGFNYLENINLNEFLDFLYELNRKNSKFILSFDGRTNEKRYGAELPESLNLIKIEINAGRSSQATLLNRTEITFESVYISPALASKINVNELRSLKEKQEQLLFVN
jgi:DNA adenine methylase